MYKQRLQSSRWPQQTRPLLLLRIARIAGLCIAAGLVACYPKLQSSPSFPNSQPHQLGTNQPRSQSYQVHQLFGSRYAMARLAYLRSVALGSIHNYEKELLKYTTTQQPYAGIDWYTNGCTTPTGLDFGYRHFFHRACLVHDFAYNNFALFEPLESNRAASDETFLDNMLTLCYLLETQHQANCQITAHAYYLGVRLGGMPYYYKDYKSPK